MKQTNLSFSSKALIESLAKKLSSEIKSSEIQIEFCNTKIANSKREASVLLWQKRKSEVEKNLEILQRNFEITKSLVITPRLSRKFKNFKLSK